MLDLEVPPRRVAGGFWFVSGEIAEKDAYRVILREIKENDFNLNIFRYADTSEDSG